MKLSTIFFWLNFFAGLTTIFLPQAALAHVGYVVSKSEMQRQAGHDFLFLLKPLAQPQYVFLMLGTIAVILLLYFLLKRSSFVSKWIVFIKERTKSYAELISWMLRLSLGIALIGAGTAQVFISPALPHFPHFSFIQIFLGFILLAGFLLAPATWFVVLLFLLALSNNFYLLGNADFFAASIVLLILANPKPGLDDLLGVPFLSPLKKLREFAPLILRIGIGGAMMFLAVYEKFLNPHLSAAVVESFHLTSVIPVSPEMWVLSAGLIEFIVGFALLVGLQTRLVAAIAFAVLTLSFFYFGEEVYSHVTLFGILSVLFVTGGGRWSFDSYYAKSDQNI
jgi:uncharacterized membrane protein YphA (DoxX/SURF4 family)